MEFNYRSFYGVVQLRLTREYKMQKQRTTSSLLLTFKKLFHLKLLLQTLLKSQTHFILKMTSSSSAIKSVLNFLSEICAINDSHDCWENPRKFSSYAKRLHVVISQLVRSSLPEHLPASAKTSIKGIAENLKNVAASMEVYGKKSKIYVLIYCESLCISLQEATVAIGGWLALLDSSIDEIVNPDLHKKIADLSNDMKQAQYRVTENEERVHHTLQKEGEGRPTSKIIQSAIVMDLARALGIDSNNPADLLEQVQLLKKDLACSSSVSERRILTSVERIVDNWSTETHNLAQTFDVDSDDDLHISPFKNFLCPLTKTVMKNPVVLESSLTYERAAISYWFDRCLEDGRDPTCPVTGQVLNSLEQKPNIGLAGAIEEWTNRNIENQITCAVQYLSEDSPSMEHVEKVFDNMHKITEENQLARYKVRIAGIDVLLVKFLKTFTKSMGSHVRSKGLMALLSIAKDEESKITMLEEGVSRLTIHSLIGSSEIEREYAVRLLLELSSDEAYCAKIASEKGALVLLSSMAGNSEQPSLSNLAEEVLRRMEGVEENIKHLAVAGRFEPLLNKLCEGSDDGKIEMACMVGSMTLTNSAKEQIARRSAKTLVDLLSNPEGRTPSLRALHNLSCLDDNVTILVDSAVLPALTNIMFEIRDSSAEQKELAAAVIANLVSKPGQWELASADKERNLLQSESIISSLLGLLSLSSPQCQLSTLQILYGIAQSPHASESVMAHIKLCDGLKSIITFLDYGEVEHRTYAFRLTRLLSDRLGEELATELKNSNKLHLIKNEILDTQATDGKRSEAACILANLPLSDGEVKDVLGPNFVGWIVATLKEQHRSSNLRTSRPISVMDEGLLGLLLHFTRSPDQESINIIKEHRIMTIFCEQLVFSSKAKERKLATLGLKYLSETGRAISGGESEPQPPHGFCASLIFMCRRGSSKPSACLIHNSPCEEESQLCLLKGNCIKPLVDLLKDDDTSVQIAAVEALSTLALDTYSANFEHVVDELERLGVVNAVFLLFIQARSGELQEKALWMVERMLRVENQTQKNALNQPLVKALVEAFKHGNTVTKKHAQDALTSLKQISGVSGKTSVQNRGRR